MDKKPAPNDDDHNGLMKSHNNRIAKLFDFWCSIIVNDDDPSDDEKSPKNHFTDRFRPTTIINRSIILG